MGFGVNGGPGINPSQIPRKDCTDNADSIGMQRRERLIEDRTIGDLIENGT